MKKWMGMALVLCLLLTACSGETAQAPEQEKSAVPAEEPVQTQEQPEAPGESETPEEPAYADWQIAYATFLEKLAEQVKVLRDTDRPDYDPNTVNFEVGESSGTYVLYDIDKDSVPELMIRYGLGEAGYHTTVYGYREGAVTEIGDVSTGHTSLYTWPEENAVACNWGHMGGHFVDKLSIAGGGLEETQFFEEDNFDDPEKPYTPMADIVPGSVYLRETRTLTELPELGGLTLPIYDYGRDRTAAEIDPERDAAAKSAIENVLQNGGAFYGVTSDGFGGDAGWTTLEAYLQPGGVTEYADLPLEVTEQVWLDFNGDGQRDVLLTVRNAEGDRFSDTKCVIFAEQEKIVYAYCMNYMESYRLEETIFRSDLMEDAFSVSFDKEQCYEYGVE